MSVRLLLDVAIAYHLRGELEIALAYYGYVMDEDPDNEIATYNIGRVFQEAEQRAETRGEN